MKSSSFQIGKLIKNLCGEICPAYAVIADKGATYPFFTYRRYGIQPSADKDGLVCEWISVELTLAATSYEESIRLITEIKEKLELKRCQTEYMRIYDTRVVGCAEYWSDDVYVQTLQIQFKVDKQ